MSALFNVRVLDKDDKKGQVDLELTIVNPDQKSFYNTKSFALLLIVDPFLTDDSLKNPALFKEISREDIDSFDLDIIRKKENKLIKKVELSDIRNFPLPSELETFTDEQARKFWSDEKNLPRAVISIVTKDAAYISHLKKGQTWESGAFNVI